MKRSIFGVMIDDIDKKALTREILKRVKERRRTVIFTPNPIMTQNAKCDPDFMRILNSSDYNVPDGSGMILASRLLKTPLGERICGIELAEELLPHFARDGIRLFLYGGRDGVAREAAARLCKKYEGLKICGALNGYQSNEDETIRKIKAARADAVYVCLGSPKQEKWISENADKLPQAALFIGLGGSLDVWSGRVRRAPRCVQKSGFEWLWRMGASPKKLKSLPKLASFGISALAKGLSNVGIMHR